MNYKLAKKLFEAGFPFRQKRWEIDDYPPETYKLPTLSELIKECGDKFSQLNKWDKDKEPKGKWSAVADIPYN